MSFIDDYSKYTKFYQLQRKYQVFDCLQHFTQFAECKTGQKLFELCSNNRREYLSERLQDWCCARGIKQTMGPPHTPELNGVEEQYNCTLLDRLKPSLKNSTLHQEFWSNTLEYAVWATNRSRARTNKGFKTPYEVYKEKLPLMHHAHIFGAKGIYLLPSADRNKLDDHSRDCFFLAPLPHDDCVKVLDAESRRTIKSLNAIFNESDINL